MNTPTHYCCGFSVIYHSVIRYWYLYVGTALIFPVALIVLPMVTLMYETLKIKKDMR